MSSLRLGLECVALFVALPLAALLIDGRFAVFGLLWGMAFLTGLYAWRHDKERFFAWPAKTHWRGAFILLIAAFVGIAVAAWLLVPHRFFTMPIERPQLMLTISLLYPLLSALPQEIVYRGFFMRRYKPLFKDERVMIVASALAFAFAHIVFGNWIALALSFIGGVVFASSYARSKSLPLVVFEHALYGIFVFASGLGWYFFLGAGHSWF